MVSSPCKPLKIAEDFAKFKNIGQRGHLASRKSDQKVAESKEKAPKPSSLDANSWSKWSKSIFN